jgi:hypothetical protein
MEGLTEGRIVHFILNKGRNIGDHRPAIVVRVWRMADGTPPTNGCCQLQVFTDDTNDGLPCVMWETSILYDEKCGPGTWHWIEKA